METKIQLEVKLPVTVHATQEKFEGPDRTFVLLHGYGETKERIKRKLLETVKPFGNEVITVNAPFPIPILTEKGTKEAYSWFFRSRRLGVTLADPSVNQAVFSGLVSELSLRSRKCILIGFSQGGMVLPILARELPQVEAMIAISIGIDESDLGQSPGVPLHIIHGNSDSQSDLNFAREEFAKLRAEHALSSFVEVEGGHDIDPVKLDAVRSILERLDQGVRP
jgi:predicted esterase